MTNSLAPAPSRTSTGHDEDIEHIVCDCQQGDVEPALCGLDVTNHRMSTSGDPRCVVCHDLDDIPCERCGE